ncbi:esterase-like activity of phytase family protein [uncultured Microbacterium sp.]|uniref:Alkaline phosphatase n=1 Tax=uncultured Microbacterium sp. TaxID=191216 RepID=A0A1Y5P1Q3_9MICO|nr:esterase-like activity of phytase family protein [uncultured Microbacterium sp.]SBS72636.1 conserved exported hypothetical protein [uncultured Microbacterium sp.]
MSRTPRVIACVAAAAVFAAALPATVPSLAATASAAENKSFQRVATYPVYKNVPAGVSASAPTVAEISAVSEDGKTLIYTDALGKRIGFLDISDPADPVGAGTLSLATLGNIDDQPTSVAVVGRYVLVVVDTSKSFTDPSGRLDVVRISDAKRVRSIDLGGQPDSIALSADKGVAAIAIENQRDEDFTPADAAKGDLPQAPAGFLQLLSLEGAPADWSLRRVDLTADDGSALPSFTAAGIVEPTDPEPEYVSINGDGLVALTLQENNGIVLVDSETAAITDVFSAGSVDLTGIDAKKDGIIRPTDSLAGVRREPDSVVWIDDEHLATANEGDWKGGSRGWTVFDKAGTVVWDAGNSFERLAIRHGVYNDDRAAKKGAEPEGLAVAEYDGTTYAFVGSERSNVVAVYDMTDPAAPAFTQLLPATNGPEGLLPIPSRGLFAVSSETDDAAVNVRATVGIYEWKPGRATYPTIVSDDDASGAPIGWQALGALSGDPTDASTLWSAADTVIKSGTLFQIDVSKTPARVTRSVPITDGGSAVALDVEGVFARPQGGFWLASEGATGDKNVLVRADDAGAVQERIALPADVSSKIKNWGLEGVTATTDAGGEHVWFVIQRPLWSDLATLEDFEGDDVVRIGRYDVSDASFHWYGYRLQSPLRGSGDWVGLSEITAVDDHTFAVIERDKLNGPAARTKRIYTVTVPYQDGRVSDPTTAPLPILEKRLAIDVLPALRATDGWTQEKLEGFTIAADGRLYGVTDNDGLKDATGETVFLKLGKATDAFADALATTTSLRLDRATAPYGAKVAAKITVSGAQNGAVEIREGAKVIAKGAAKNGVATVTLPALSVGKHQLVAQFAGGPRAGASRSVATSLTVTKAASRTTVKAAKTSVKRNAAVALTVTVTGANHTPTGSVRFVAGGKVIATAVLKNGKATAPVTFSRTGVTSVTAVYSGSAQTTGSTSGSVRITVR